MRSGRKRDADSKLRELILYIADYCQQNGKLQELGTTKLSKILFYSDFAAYLKLGKAITDQEYCALEWGAAPKRMAQVREQMEKAEEIQVIQPSAGPKYTEDIIVPLRKSRLLSFTAEEISIVDQVILRFVFTVAPNRSDESHRFIGWDAASLNEIIPYSSAYLDAPHILGERTQMLVPKSTIEYARRLEPEAARLREKYA
jgi:hypothetical protein